MDISGRDNTSSCQDVSLTSHSTRGRRVSCARYSATFFVASEVVGDRTITDFSNQFLSNLGIPSRLDHVAVVFGVLSCLSVS